jgi:peroxiredoxin Q/BCP
MTMRQVGESAPDFTSVNDSGKQISLRDYRGRWVVLFFYPKDDTPG